MYFRANAVVATLVVSACFVDNGTSTADPTTSSSTGAPTTGGVDPSTTTATTPPGDTSSTSTPDATTSADDTTGVTPPLDCWDQDVASWPEQGSRLELGEAIDPFITHDGLNLYYLGLPDRRPYLSTRTKPLDPFLAGIPLAKWLELAPTASLSSPIVLLDGAVMLVALQDDTAIDIHYAFATPQEPDKFALPQPVPGIVNTAENQETSLTATPDTNVLIVQRNDGPPLDVLPFTYTFRQFVRTNNAEQYMGGGDVTPQNPPFNLAFCPVLSADGLRLFYSSTVGDTFTPAEYTSFAIHYTTRSAIDEPWDTPVLVPGLIGSDGIVCASSVTIDGCQLAYHTTIYDGTQPSLYVASRLAP